MNPTTPRAPRRPTRSARILVALVSALVAAAPVACGSDSSQSSGDPRLQNPLLRVSAFRDTAPPTFRARFQTTQGTFVVEVHRDWAPLGADRFYNLVKGGWYDGVRFHRVLEGFVAEWGIHDDPYVNAVWRKRLLVDDPVTQTNTRGRVTFSRSGPNSRTTQVFVNLGDNRSLDDQGFAPFGEVVQGMEVVESLYSGYGDGPPRGEGVYQAMAIARGGAYFDEEFPELDRIESASLVASGGP